MIAVLDYGIGNLANLINALKFIKADLEIITDASQLRSQKKIILPGVGAFKAAMRNLTERGFDKALKNEAKAGAKILGVCVGMQVLFESSEEDGYSAGLGLIPGEIKRLTKAPKIPHMGWNRLNNHQPHPLLKGIDQQAWFYFVHSYADLAESAYGLATTDYYQNFSSIVAHGNIFGAQFHPEKSQNSGLQLLNNFKKL